MLYNVRRQRNEPRARRRTDTLCEYGRIAFIVYRKQLNPRRVALLRFHDLVTSAL